MWVELAADVEENVDVGLTIRWVFFSRVKLTAIYRVRKAHPV